MSGCIYLVFCLTASIEKKKKLKNAKAKNYPITIEKLGMHIQPTIVCAKYQWKFTAKVTIK